MAKNSQPQDTVLQVTEDSYQRAVGALQVTSAFTADQVHALTNAFFYLCHQPAPSPADGEQSYDQANESDQDGQA